MTERTQELSGQVAIVTGAGRGIGRAIAIAYAQAGAAVCCAARTGEEITTTVRDIVTSGGRALAVPADVTQLASVQQMLQTTVETFGGLDILVINAGGNYDRRHVAESHPEDWRARVCWQLGLCLLQSGFVDADAGLGPGTLAVQHQRQRAHSRASCYREECAGIHAKPRGFCYRGRMGQNP